MRRLLSRLPIVRHIRYFYWHVGLRRHYERWNTIAGRSSTPDAAAVYYQMDLWHLNRIWRGEA
jgi:hypothetical protein